MPGGGIALDSRQQTLRFLGRRNFTVQQRIEGPVLAVKGADIIIILADHGAAQRNPEKQATRA